MTVTLNVNGTSQPVEADPATPLLYVLRDHLKLNGAKFGCGLGQCGACTVMVDGEAVFSCLTPISVLQDRKIRTVEDAVAFGLLCTTSVKTAEAPLGSTGSLAVTVPVPPGAGWLVTVQPAGAMNDTKVVPVGIVSVSWALCASLGPLLVTVIV